jgi:hypothetical protein
VNSHIEIWNDFCSRMRIVDTGALLFKTSSSGAVATIEIGRLNHRQVISRSQGMENLVVSEVDKLVSDWESSAHKYDGLIYMMYQLRKDKVLPLYIGKTETIGKGEGNLSVNIRKYRQR